MSASPALPLVVKQRRAFGLDHARQPDPARVAAELVARLAEALPEVVPLRVQAAGDETGLPVLVLVPPDGRIAILRIGPRRERPDHTARALEAACRRSQIPLARLSRIEEAHGALRRCGFEIGEA